MLKITFSLGLEARRGAKQIKTTYPVDSVSEQKKTMKTTKISISDFDFTFWGYGHYKVTYTSPVTRKSWSIVTNDMPIIDATKNADEPKKKDLETLKRLVKTTN